METMTLKQINSAIAKVGKAQDKTNADIHVLLCHLTMHALENSGDVDGFNRLLAAVKGTDRKAIVDWSVDFAPVKFSKDGKATLNQGRFKELTGVVSLAELIEGPTWLDGVKNMREVVRTLDIEARVASLLESLEKAQAEGKPVKNEGLAEYLRTALIRFASEKVEGAIVPAANDGQAQAAA